MEISINGNFEKFLKEQMATGLYNSVNDIVQEALSLLISRKSAQQERLDALNAELQKGLDDIEAGNYSDGDEFFRELVTKYE